MCHTRIHHPKGRPSLADLVPPNPQNTGSQPIHHHPIPTSLEEMHAAYGGNHLLDEQEQQQQDGHNE